MEINKLRSLIRETVAHNLKEIEEVAENAAMEAKSNAYTEAIEKVKKKIETAESLEELQELVDPTKLNELKKHLKLLEKSKEKLDKVKAKKNKKVVTDEPTEEDADIKEDDIYKVEKMGGEANWNDKQRGLSWNSDQLYDDAQLEEGDDKEDGDDDNSFYDDEMKLNESFLKMQKLAGVITESQYNEAFNMAMDNNSTETAPGTPPKKEDANIKTIIARLKPLVAQLKANDTALEFVDLIET